MDLEVVFPKALNITACTFGGKQAAALAIRASLTPRVGPNGDQLYVTTAHCGACGGDATRQADYPDSGNLFVVDLSGAFVGGEWRFKFAG